MHVAYLPRSSLTLFNENKSYKLDLYKLEKSYLDAWSHRPNLNKLQNESPGDSPNQI